MTSDDLYRILGRLEAQSSAIHELIKDHVETDRRWHEIIERRLMNLEQESTKLSGSLSNIILPRPRPSFPPRWVKGVLGHSVTKAIVVVLAALSGALVAHCQGK